MALDHSMGENSKVLLLGLGITDPKRFFGTTENLLEKYSSTRVIECPTSENAYLGHSLGLSLGGFQPIVHFQRMDFMLYAFDQLINNIAKWQSMFNLPSAPNITIRTVVGMGWGQGAQHSHNYSSLLAQIPGLKILTPSCPASAYHLLRNSINTQEPTILVEHRWLQYLEQETETIKPAAPSQTLSAVKRTIGSKLTIVCWSYSTVEALRLAEIYTEIEFEIIDLFCLNPINMDIIIESVNKTGALLLWEPTYSFAGIGAEIISKLHEKKVQFKAHRFGYPQSYPPSSYQLITKFYLSLREIVEQINDVFSIDLDLSKIEKIKWPHDQDLNAWSPWISKNTTKLRHYHDTVL